MASARVRKGDKAAPANEFNAFKILPNAERPSREQGKAGWEITLVGRTDNRVEDQSGEVNNFDTGLNIKVTSGSYIEIVPHPQLIRHGYMLPGPLIIDATHSGALVIPLYKFCEGQDLELPFKAALAFLRVEGTENFKLGTLKQEYAMPMYNGGVVMYPAGMVPMQMQARAGAPPPKGRNHMF